MKLRKFSIVLLAAAICFALAPVGASADPSVAAVLSPVASVKQGGTVAITGTSTLSEVIIKVLRPDNAGIVYYDIVKVTDGRFAVSFTLLASEPAGTYQVIAGQASQVSSRELVVQAADVVVPPVNPPVNPGPVVGPGGAPAAGTGLAVTIGGSVAGSIATAAAAEQNGKTVVTVTVDAQQLSAGLANAGDKPSVVIPVTAASDKTSVVLTGDAVKALENKNAVLEIRTPNGSYKLPAVEVLIDQLAGQFGTSATLSSITVQVEIAKSDEAAAQLLANAARKGEYTIVVPPVDFTVTASYGGQTVNVTRFQAYVEREIPLPAGVDASKVTTAIVLNADGTPRSVPTKIVTRDGVSYAIVNSLTNSAYALIRNPVAFGDMEGHWAKQAVNNMGSRLIISGIGGGRFSPDRDITRAEFAAIVVRGLGLEQDGGGASEFSDVQPSAWYNGAISTAHAYGLIGGFEDGTFRPNDRITREQAMVIIAKAMKITQLQGASPEHSPDRIETFADADELSGWAISSAADSIQAGLISGRGNHMLAPKAYVTRAEVASIIERLLTGSDLI